MKSRHRIQFPPANVNDLGQDEVFFFLMDGDDKRRIRLHDYNEIYRVPGLYEQVIYERLRCQSPQKVVRVLENAVKQAAASFTELRVLDLGAGNGVVGEELQKHDVSRLIGIDIVEEARLAAQRDRPGVYDAYYVADVTHPATEQRQELEAWSLDCLMTVAALGFGDIPPLAFIEALNLIDERGWVAFNIKETFFERSDETGFSKLIRELIFSEYLELHHLERYRHRYSFEGEPLYYFAVAGRKRSHVPEDFLTALEMPAP